MSQMLLREHITNAVLSLRRTRTRTLLTVVGVAIGVGSITIILSLSQGVTGLIKHQVDRTDGTVVLVRPGYPSQQNSTDFGNPLGNTSYGTSTLSRGDVTDVKKIPGVQAVAPLMLISGIMKSPEHPKGELGTIVATSPQFASINHITMESGGFLDGATSPNTAVIGQQLAVDLFGTQSPLGQQFSIRGQEFTIIGVLERTNNPVNYNNFDLDNAVYVSMESGENFHQGSAQIQQIDIKVKDKSSIDKVKKDIAAALQANHLGEKDFTIVSGTAITEPTNQLFRAFTATMTAIAAISLVVGGIGIMNIMLVGVAERTREIGLRKAVGASNGQITIQFLIEALIMSLLGGLVGFIGGYILAYLASMMLPFYPSLNWQIALMAFCISLGVGLLFGAYPALRAARKDAIESLRIYH